MAGGGTFALSVQQERIKPETAAEWAWSSDIPHHLTVTDNEVSVVRWDEPTNSTRFTRKSVDSDLEGFYRYLLRDSIQSTTSVVEHLVHLFRQMRSLVHDAGHRDDNALVQVGCLVVANRVSPPGTRATAVVTEDDPRATGDALRWLRKIDELPPPLPVKESRWAIFGVPKADLSQRDTWRFLTPAADELITRLGSLFGLLGDVFDVRQGVQTGHNPAFVLTKEELAKLPRPERQFFRLATMTDSIEFCQLVKPYYVFFPHEGERALFETEDAMKRAVPTYYRKYLLPHEERLKARKAIRDAGRADWWGLMRHREWSASHAPKIISKYFGQIGAFWLDEKGTALPLTGFAWVLKQSGSRRRSEHVLSLQAYEALFNSDVFQRLLSVYCPRVSGGQFDLITDTSGKCRYRLSQKQCLTRTFPEVSCRWRRLGRLPTSQTHDGGRKLTA